MNVMICRDGGIVEHIFVFYFINPSSPVFSRVQPGHYNSALRYEQKFQYFV